VLKNLNIGKTGFHAFRRFRNTYLRNYTSCPDGLRKYWLAWGSEEMQRTSDRMSDNYDRISEDAEFRRTVAEKIGVGFKVPTPNDTLTPQNAVKSEMEVAA